MSDDSSGTAPAPPPTTHADDRELGFGAVDARPDLGDSEAAPGKLPDAGSESAGGAYAGTPAPSADDDHAGQSQQGYSGGDNPNATSTKDASRDRAS